MSPFVPGSRADRNNVVTRVAFSQLKLRLLQPSVLAREYSKLDQSTNNMATTKQIELRLGQQKTKIEKLTAELKAAREKKQSLQGDLKAAKAAAKAS